jgi:hypothetical protein
MRASLLNEDLISSCCRVPQGEGGVHSPKLTQ